MNKKAKAKKDVHQIIPLPRANAGIIIQYTPRLVVSCLVPGKKQAIKMNRKITERKGQALIWSQTVNDGKQPAINDKISVFRVRIRKFKQKGILEIDTAPHSGCWGNVKRPKNLREANTRYWGSGFHTWFYNDGYWRDGKRYILGDKHLKLDAAEGLLISSNVMLKRKFPKYRKGNLVFLPLKETDNHWEVVFKEAIRFPKKAPKKNGK